VKIALLQGPSEPGTVAENLAVLAAAATRAAAAGATMLMTPEMFLTGYNIGPSVVAAAAETPDGPSSAAVADIATSTGVAILYGYPERDDGGVYNSVQLIDSSGVRRAHYRKTHLYGDVDRSQFTAGDRPSGIVELDGTRVGLLICYDVEFPENVRALALEGADLVAVPTALMKPYELVARSVVPVRAYENSLFVAYANRVGTEEDFVYCGESCVIAPDGSELARAGSSDDLIFADIDLARVRTARREYTNLSDRRPELYEALLVARLEDPR